MIREGVSARRVHGRVERGSSRRVRRIFAGLDRPLFHSPGGVPDHPLVTTGGLDPGAGGVPVVVRRRTRRRLADVLVDSEAGQDAGRERGGVRAASAPTSARNDVCAARVGDLRAAEKSATNRARGCRSMVMMMSAAFVPACSRSVISNSPPRVAGEWTPELLPRIARPPGPLVESDKHVRAVALHTEPGPAPNMERPGDAREWRRREAARASSTDSPGRARGERPNFPRTI